MRTTPTPAVLSDPTLDEKLQRLEALLRHYGRVLLAYSGGVDSALLLQVAAQTLGRDNVLAVLGQSASLASGEAEQAAQLAREMQVPFLVLETNELANENYVRNPSNRCYFCKTELYDHLARLAGERGFPIIADGTNLDDVGDTRPGRLAAAEHGVRSPLLEAGLRKSDVRELSRRFNLPTWDKPESPCLASRIPYGQRVDTDKLRQIDQAEQCLKAAGVRGGRVRHHGEIARIELPEGEMARLTDASFRRRLLEGMRHVGFRFVVIDIEGYRRGRLNEAAGALPRSGS